MTEGELDEILTFEWPGVIRWAKRQSDEWLAQFALSIAGKGKRKSWRPTSKQVRVMRRMLSEAKADNHRLLTAEPDIELIER
ncbi:MAG: hypothetical protein AAGF30_06085 [Pseudomonadota bacterium]